MPCLVSKKMNRENLELLRSIVTKKGNGSFSVVLSALSQSINFYHEFFPIHQFLFKLNFMFFNFLEFYQQLVRVWFW